MGDTTIAFLVGSVFGCIFGLVCVFLIAMAIAAKEILRSRRPFLPPPPANVRRLDLSRKRRYT